MTRVMLVDYSLLDWANCHHDQVDLHFHRRENPVVHLRHYQDPTMVNPLYRMTKTDEEFFDRHFFPDGKIFSLSLSAVKINFPINAYLFMKMCVMIIATRQSIIHR